MPKRSEMTAESMTHGRFGVSERPLMTGPATPKHAATGCSPVLKKSEMMLSRPECSELL
jgi:hypothetical protein